MSEQYVSPLPPVGLPIRWFERGIPWPATVMQTTDRGIIDVEIHKRDGYKRNVQGVFHITNPAFEKMDNLARSQRGGWDYIPGLRVDMNETPQAAPEDKTIPDLKARVAKLESELATLKDGPQPDIEDQIIQLASTGMEPAKIAERVRVPHQKVVSVLSRQKAKSAKPE